MAEKKAADQQGFLSTATKKLNLGSSGHTLDGTYMPSIGERYKRPKTGIEEGFEKAGKFLNKLIGVQAAEGATLDDHRGFVNKGVVTPSSYGVGDNKDTKVASGGVNWDKANWINKVYGGKASGWYERNPGLPDSSNPHVPAGSYFPRASIKTGDENRIVSDTTQTLGAKEGSLLAMADTGVRRGITTAAPETKIDETKRMAGGFFSPKNFQKSGVPDATIMTREQMGQALTGDPGYTRFGSLDRPGTQAAKDTAAFNERVKSDFFSPVKADARSISERREANEQSMRERASESYAAFKERGGRPAPTTQISGDDTYGTGVMSNPAFGFRSKMSDENKAKYDASAREATRRSEVEPSKGNLVASVANAMKRGLNTAIGAEGGTPLTRETKLETRGAAEQRRYEKYLNRPRYQREATARREAGITNQMTIDKNKEQVRADAEARNRKFQSERRAAAVERAARRTPENTGTGRSGRFGAGTTGKGMPSNPPGMRQTGVGKSANNLSRHSTGSSADQPSSTPSGDTSFSSYVRGGGEGQKRGQAVNKAKGFKSSVSTTTRQGKPRTKAQMAAAERKASGKTRSERNAARKKSMRDKARARNKSFKARRAAKAKARKAKNASNKAKRTRTRRSRNRRSRGRSRRCDIFLKYNISPLTNMNLIRDDLAEIAYFVKEIQK